MLQFQFKQQILSISTLGFRLKIEKKRILIWVQIKTCIRVFEKIMEYLTIKE